LRRYKNAVTNGHEGLLPLIFNLFRLNAFDACPERLENIVNKTNIAGLFWVSHIIKPGYPERYCQMKLIKPIPLLNWKNWLQLMLLTLLLFFAFLFYNNGNFVLDGEESLLTRMDIGREMLLPKTYKAPYRFIFINVGKDLQLTKDDYGADNVITDREKLASFFQLLNNHNKHKYLLADLVFDLPADNDSLLEKELPRLQKVIFPKHLGDSGLLPSVFSVPSAIADYNTSNKKFSKFRLMYGDSLKTLPVAIHEALEGVTYKVKRGSLYCNGKYNLHTIPPRYFIRPYQLQTAKQYPYFNLGDLLVLANDSTFYDQFLEDRFIVLGNFDTDIHITPIGKMPGVLILLNTYLSLKDGRAQPSIAWFTMIFVIFFIINLYVFFGKKPEPKKTDHKTWWQLFIYNLLNGILANFVSIAGLCLMITILSDFIFHIKPYTFIIFMYIIIWQGILKYYQVWKKQQQPAQKSA